MESIKRPEDCARAARMARARMPDYQIAFILGMGVKRLRALYGPEMMAAAIEAELEVREMLLRIATSGKNAAATMFWARAQGGFESAPEREPKKANNKEVYGVEPWSPDDFQVFGPNGERLA